MHDDHGARPISAGRQRAGDANRERAKARRDAAYAEGVAQWPALSAETSFRDFVVLYIAEGYKRDRNTVAICNSDPAVIRPALLWMQRLAINPIQCAVQHHLDQDLSELRVFWGLRLHVPLETIVFHRKTNSGRLSGRRWRCEHGVMTVRCSDTQFRARLEAWIQIVRAGWLDSPDGV